MSDQLIRTLLVEDNPTDVLSIHEALLALPAASFEITDVEGLALALQQLRQAKFDVVLLDLGLPDSQGLATLVKVQEHAPQTPIIVLTDLADEVLGLHAVQAGAQDYLVKGQVAGGGLARAIRYAIERKRAEAALRQSEARFAAAFHASPAAMLITRARNGRIIDVNASYERLFGYRRDELIGQTGAAVNIYTSPEQRADIVRLLREHGSLRDLELVLRAKSGELCTTLSSLESFDLDGEPCLLGTMVDITGRKRAEQAMERSAERLHILADASRAFAEVGTEYQTLLDQVARTTATMLGEGCNIRLLSDDAEWLQLAALYDENPEKLELIRIVLGEAPLRVDEPSVATRIFQSRQPVLLPVVDREQVRAATKPEYRSLVDRLGLRSMIFVPMRVQGRAIGVLILYRYQPEQPPFDEDDLGLAQDLADRAALAVSNTRLLSQVQRELAERTRAQADLEEERALLARRVAERTADLSLANAELERTARLKDEFLASMSHELRTPLNAILGLSEALQEQIYGPLNDKQRQTLGSIEEGGRHLLALITDILDLSKIGAGMFELDIGPVPVESVCQASLQLIKQAAHKQRLTVSFQLDSAVTTIQADMRRLKQILVNLLSNAVKFTAPGGTIGLEVAGDAERNVVTFTVWDTGIGIAPDDLVRLFQPFVQLDSRLARQYEGTGLGLSLVGRMVELHGGSMTVTSEPNTGSRFVVALPWQAPEAIDSDAIEAPHILDTQHGIAVHRALIIEDSPSAAEQLTRYLHELDVETIAHPQGNGSVALAREIRPEVIFLDILLPTSSGWEVLAQLKDDPQTRDIPVVIVSVVDEQARAMALGAAGYLVKPITRQQIQAVLGTLAAPGPEGDAHKVAPDQGLGARSPLILLAEDNQANITTLADYLLVKGYQVVVARNGAEAIGRAMELHPDLILMDIQMPGMDGLEATRRIRADGELADIPIIALTALAMPGDRERCLNAGANDYLSKPVSLKGLVAAIEALLP